MKFICLAYHNEQKMDKMSKAEKTAFIQDCFAYDNELRKSGHIIRLEALQNIKNTATLRYQNGTVAVTDGPFTETKEQLGGILILEARDFNHAIQLMSKHPGMRCWPFEIRPADEEINALTAAEES
jgi:hypothetical protein